MDDSPRIIDITPEDDRAQHHQHHGGNPHHTSRSQGRDFNHAFNFHALDRPSFSLSPALLAFLAAAVLLGIQAVALTLFKDDHVHIFPSLLKDYLSHFTQFTYDYGLSRPLGLLYFYAIYTLSLASLPLAHLTVYIAHALAGFLLYTVFSRRISHTEAMILAVLFLVFPFFTEQWGWFAAGNATLAIAVLAGQIALLDSDRIDPTVKMGIVGVLQAVGVLLYETLFFTFIPLILAYALRDKHLFTKRNAIASIFLTVPSLAYYVLKTFIFPAHYEGFARESALNMELSGTIVRNAASFGTTMKYLFLEEGPRTVFWQTNVTGGISLILGNVALFAAAAVSLSLLSYAVYTRFRMRTLVALEHERGSFFINPIFWLLLGATALLPAFALSQPAFPFRVLALPFYALLVALMMSIRLVSGRAMTAIGAVMILICIPSTLNILDLMRLQGMDDERHFIQVVEGVNRVTAEDDTVAVQIQGMPHSTRTTFAFGEYLSTCASADWCLQAAVNRRTGRIQKVYVGQATASELRVIPFRYDPVTRDLVLDESVPDIQSIPAPGEMFMIPDTASPEAEMEATGEAVMEASTEAGMEGFGIEQQPGI